MGQGTGRGGLPATAATSNRLREIEQHNRGPMRREEEEEEEDEQAGRGEAREVACRAFKRQG